VCKLIVVNHVTQYVVSTTLREEPGENLVILGSGVLITALLAARLIDELLLLIHPFTLGTGRRLFAEGTRARLTLNACSQTGSGVLITSYRTAA
jgi:dihydrofolate reductase